MRFSNIDHQKLDPVVVLCIEIAKAHGLVDERRSGETAKNEGDRLVAAQVGETNGILPVYIVQFEIWRNVSDFWGQGVEPFLPGFFFLAYLNVAKHVITPFQNLIYFNTDSFPAQTNADLTALPF